MAKNVFTQFTSYSIIGILCVAVDFLSYNLMAFFLGVEISIAKAISFVLGSVNSFILNKRITFKSNAKPLKEILLFCIVYIVSLLVNYYTHDYFLKISSGYIPFVTATIFSIAINFSGQKLIVFRK